MSESFPHTNDESNGNQSECERVKIEGEGGEEQHREDGVGHAERDPDGRLNGSPGVRRTEESQQAQRSNPTRSSIAGMPHAKVKKRSTKGALEKGKRSKSSTNVVKSSLRKKKVQSNTVRGAPERLVNYDWPSPSTSPKSVAVGEQRANRSKRLQNVGATRKMNLKQFTAVKSEMRGKVNLRLSTLGDEIGSTTERGTSVALHGTTRIHGLGDASKEATDEEIERVVVEQLDQYAKVPPKQRTRGLSLTRLRLAQVPSNLLKFAEVTVLDLSHNQLTEIPPDIFLMRLLKKLNLRNNRINKLPALIGTLGRLENLNLSRNRLANMPNMQGLLRLEVLYAQHNRLRAIPESLSRLYALRVLNLSQNKIPIVLENMGEMCGLEELYLSHNRLERFDPAISQLFSLVVLDVSHNKIKSFDSLKLADVPELDELDVSHNPVSETLLEDSTPESTVKQLRAIVKRQHGSQIFRRRGSLKKRMSVDLFSFMSITSSKKLHSPEAVGARLSEVLGNSSSTETSSSEYPGGNMFVEYRERALSRTPLKISTLAGGSMVFRRPSALARFLEPVDGFRVDSPSSQLTIDTVQLTLEDHCNYADYAEFISNAPHYNLVGQDDKLGPIVVSVAKKAHALSRDEAAVYRALLRSKFNDIRVFVPAKNVKQSFSRLPRRKDLMKALSNVVRDINGTGLELKALGPVENPRSFVKEYCHLEQRMRLNSHKFGVLYVKEGQTDENDFYTNNEPSELYDEFLNLIGERVKLQGWSKYAGGLDVKRNSTGTHSVYTNAHNLEIMFHVSTLLPFLPRDEQMVERKRHLGNDIAIVVFYDGKGKQTFSPTQIHSHFNHVFAVVQPDHDASEKAGKTMYRFGVICKDDVPQCEPGIPAQSFAADDRFRMLLLTKLINAERQAYSAPSFSRAIRRSRQELLSELVKQNER